MNKILVVGRERSGTKFTTNLIALNLDLSCIQSEQHGGVIETNLLQAYPRCFGKLPSEENKKAALYLLSHEYFYRFSRLNEENLWQLKFDSFQQLFNRFLNYHAQLGRQTGWVYKADSRYLYEYQSLDAKLIVVRRKIINQVWSFVKNRGAKLGYIRMVKYILSAYLHRKVERYWAGKQGCKIYNYEDIQADPKAFLKDMAQLLDTSFAGNVRLPGYNNSSFRSNKEKTEISSHIRFWNLIARFITFWLPSSLLAVIFKLKFSRKMMARFVADSFPSLFNTPENTNSQSQ